MKVLREEALKRELLYYFGRQFRFTAEMRAAKMLVQERRLGKIYHAKATFVRSRGIPVGVGNWFTEKKRSGGGALGFGGGGGCLAPPGAGAVTAGGGGRRAVSATARRTESCTKSMRS